MFLLSRFADPDPHWISSFGVFGSVSRSGFRSGSNVIFSYRFTVQTSVPDPDPRGSEIIWPQGSGSEIINFGSGSGSGSGSLLFFTPNLEICFKVTER